MTDLEKAKSLLQEENYTCVITNGDMVLSSTERGIKPLLGWLDTKELPVGCSAADKVVGKAAAFLYVLLKTKEVYASVISKSAFEVLERHDIKVSCETLTEAIRNRTGDGLCPMEQVTWDIDDPIFALAAIRQTVKRLSERA